MGDEKRSYCTILDEVAKDGNLNDFVETIHHACMSSVLSSRRRVLLIPPSKERKAIGAKKGEGLADELRKLIIPHIRGLPAKESLTVDKLGDDIMAMGHSALYKVSGTGSSRTIGGAKIEKVIKAENGLALVLSAMPESMPVPPMEPREGRGHGSARGSSKGMHGGGFEIEIDLGSDGKGTTYLDPLSGSSLRNGILNVYRQLFPAPLKWYQMFTSSFAMFTRYNSYDLMKYTGGVPPYYRWYSLFNRHPYVAAGGILMPHLSSGYAVDETILRRFIKSPWFAYRDPTVISISSKYLANGGEYDMEGGGPEDRMGGGLTITVDKKSRGPAVLKYITQPVFVRLQRFGTNLNNYVSDLRIMVQRLRDGGPDVYELHRRGFEISVKKEAGVWEPLTDIDDTTNFGRVQLYIDFLDYLLSKTGKLTPEERRDVADAFLKSFEDVLKAIDGLKEENFKQFLGIRLTNYEKLQAEMRKLLDDVSNKGKDWEGKTAAEIIANLNNGNELKKKMGAYLADEFGYLDHHTALLEKMKALEADTSLSVADKSAKILADPLLGAVVNVYGPKFISSIAQASGNAQLTLDLKRKVIEITVALTQISTRAFNAQVIGEVAKITQPLINLNINSAPQFGGRKKKRSSSKKAVKKAAPKAEKPKKKRSSSKKRSGSKKRSTSKPRRAKKA